ncbi:TPA: hypothetical protein N0F65_004167 [Lagenidium giganteum]|uniref:Uncharacterized protein n=1 Tax=Lagenidium giganteum TaxID=4803 RepID=A0AAV2ZCN6_9STRA|nr:TPA: hypothetical protein N0F65_004167 [Lagenidium giganteum]
MFDMGDGATRLVWRHTPDLLLNEESLVEVITKLRAQVVALEKNELLSGSALPTWLVKALTEVASNVDSVVECHALQDQVTYLQKEVLELRHDLIMAQSSNSMNAFSPTPAHRQSMTSTRTKRQGSATKNVLAEAVAATDPAATGDGSATGAAGAVAVEQSATQQLLTSFNLEGVLKPVWDAIHKQTNEVASLRDAFQDTRDTCARLQSEIKRRDAISQARNNKHETTVQSQFEKLNESLRVCVSRSDLISVEQRLSAQMKSDRQRIVDDAEARSNKIIDQLLSSRADQEDINSMNAENTQVLARKIAKAEEQLRELNMKQTDLMERNTEMRIALIENTKRVDANGHDVDMIHEKMKVLENMSEHVNKLEESIKKEAETQDAGRKKSEDHVLDTVAETAVALRAEISQVNSTVTELINMDLESEIRAVTARLDMVSLGAADSARKITGLQKQVSANEEQSKNNFTQTFDSVDRIMQNISTLSEESMRLSYNLQQLFESENALAREFHEYVEKTDRQVGIVHKMAGELTADLERTGRTFEKEVVVIKNQLFSVEDGNTNLKREIEHTQHEVDRNLRAQHQENVGIRNVLEMLNKASEDMSARQDAAENQVMALQADNRAEIQTATAKLVAIVDKESDRIEALYASFQEKQDHFADIVARASIRNMDLPDLTREIDRVCETFVAECWKFETSARSSNRTSARGDNNATSRKLFNERQQQLLVKNCQFCADLVVARAEYEVLHSGCNKDLKMQLDMGDSMLDVQAGILEKVKVKVQTKIMNNKNIGEQFDKGSLDRRELYMETLKNMLDASIQRRTLVGAAAREPMETIRESDGGGGFLEAQRLVPASAGAPQLSTSRRKTSSRDRKSTIALPTYEPESSRQMFSPSSQYVLRAGFRLPRTSSPPTSPISPARKSMAALVGGAGTPGESSGEQLTYPPSPEDYGRSEALAGWTVDDKKDADMSKSFSLPVLKQQ